MNKFDKNSFYDNSNVLLSYFILIFYIHIICCVEYMHNIPENISLCESLTWESIAIFAWVMKDGEYQKKINKNNQSQCFDAGDEQPWGMVRKKKLDG